MDRGLYKTYKSHTTSIQPHYVARENVAVDRISGACNKNVTTILSGMLVEVTEVIDEGTVKICVNDTILGDRLIFDNTVWRCPRKDLIPIHPITYQFLLPVITQKERLRIVNDPSFCEFAENICIGNKVIYKCGTYTQLATVKYVGNVQELSNGNYFGLELLECCSSDVLIKPELTSSYFNSQPRKGTFATLANIQPYRDECLNSCSVDKVLLPTNGSVGQKQSRTAFTGSKIATAKDRKLDGHYSSSSFDDSKNNNNDIELFLQGKSVASQKSSYATTSKSMENFGHHFGQTMLQNIPLIVLEHKWSSDIESDKNEPEPIDEIVNALRRNVGHEREESNKAYRADNSRHFEGNNVKHLLNSDVHPAVSKWMGPLESSLPDKRLGTNELSEQYNPYVSEYREQYKEADVYKPTWNRSTLTDINNCHDRKTYNKTNLGGYSSPDASTIGMNVVQPICVQGDLESICGKNRGIQGHHNSCYLDATLFSMFAFTSAFDNLLYRPPNERDYPQYQEVQCVLREEIVNPLRRDKYVSADRVMKLRTLLEKFTNVSGLTSEEKDPEEFLNSLVTQILNAEPFLKLSSGQDAYHYQLFVDKDDDLSIPTVQQLLEQSFLTSNIKLKEVPSCFIIQMPRFGKSFKMFQKIQPTLLLDVTDIIDDSPRQCTICGKVATWECKECFGQLNQGLESIAFCLNCLERAHKHEDRVNHKPKELSVPLEFKILEEHCPVPRLFLELSAVVCIETSHYVSFVKCGSGSDANWCFFDSMADRKGEQNGYNIPEMVPCPDFHYWLSEEGLAHLLKLKDDRNLPPHAKRLLCDAYMCIYQSSDVMMYK